MRETVTIDVDNQQAMILRSLLYQAEAIRDSLNTLVPASLSAHTTCRDRNGNPIGVANGNAQRLVDSLESVIEQNA